MCQPPCFFIRQREHFLAFLAWLHFGFPFESLHRARYSGARVFWRSVSSVLAKARRPLEKPTATSGGWWTAPKAVKVPGACGVWMEIGWGCWHWEQSWVGERKGGPPEPFIFFAQTGPLVSRSPEFVWGSRMERLKGIPAPGRGLR